MRQLNMFADGAQRACTHCGLIFNVQPGVRRGRPIMFCGDNCRGAAAKAQRLAWSKQQHGPATCWSCGAPLPAHSGVGRLSRFCSKPCRAAGIARRRHAQRSSRLTK